MECTRCGVELEDGEELSKNGQSFCEDCYDHMFVSWKEEECKQYSTQEQ